MKCQSLVSCQLLNLLNVNGTISITHVLGMYRVQFSFLFFFERHLNKQSAFINEKQQVNI